MALNILFSEIKAFWEIKVLIESLCLSFALIKFISLRVKKERKREREHEREGLGEERKKNMNLIFICTHTHTHIL